MKKAILNITHADIDGAACSILLKNMFGENNVETIPIAFNRADYVCTKALDSWSKEYKKIIITDIYPSKEIAARFEGTNVCMFDHHDSGIETSKNCVVCSHKKYSAALVVASKLVKMENLTKNMKNLVFLTTDYDSYQLTDVRSRQLNLLYFGKYTFEQYIARFMDGFDGFTNSEKTYIKNVEKEIKKTKTDALDNLWTWNLGGYNVTACPIYDHMNDLTDYIFDIEPFSEIVVLLSLDRKRGSVRVRPTVVNNIKEDLDFDMAGFIEKELGSSGGGHKFAGGFSWDSANEEDGIPKFLVDFVRWDAKLGKKGFYTC